MKRKKHQEEKVKDLNYEDENTDANYKQIIRKYANDTTPTSKMNALIHKLRDIRENYDGDKTLIFSNYKDIFQIISKRLRKENINHLQFISGMGRAKRRETLELFRDNGKEYDVLLISTKCASVGLNLQCANHVIFMDPKCNLGLENQAIGRCWRLGQTKTVYVTRLITENTVEDRILSLMQDKDKNEEKGMTNLKRKAKLVERDYRIIFGIDNEEDKKEEVTRKRKKNTKKLNKRRANGKSVRRKPNVSRKRSKSRRSMIESSESEYEATEVESDDDE